MRLIVFFDLPVITKADIRQYNKFRKYLIGQGFVKMQKSVYSKLAINNTQAQAIASNIRKNRPKSGLVQIMTITEKQYQSIEFIVGESQNEIIDTLDRLIIL